jgi:hypothetical protein
MASAALHVRPIAGALGAEVDVKGREQLVEALGEFVAEFLAEFLPGGDLRPDSGRRTI